MSEDAYDLCAFDGGVLVEVFPGPRVLGERYLLEQKIAAGAMGAVFRATHLGLGSTVAVKLMQPKRDEITVGHARFFREAQILGQIKHPNAVLVMDFDVEPRGAGAVPYLVTEYLRGASLADRMGPGARFSVEDALRIIGPVCDAVHEAHEVGVIHRDVKPSNIFLEALRDGSEIVKVLDFGIAKFIERKELATPPLMMSAPLPVDFDVLDELASIRAGARTRPERRDRADHAQLDGIPSTLTDAGFMIGTIPYMAPEQMTGEPVSRATDVYAIASVLFQLLSGRLPFVGSDDEIIHAKVDDARVTLTSLGVSVPPALDDVVFRALALDPSLRPARASALRDALDEIRREARPARSRPEPLALPLKLGALGKALDRITEVLPTTSVEGSEEAYATARDRLLSLSSLLDDTEALARASAAEDEDDSTLDDERAALERAAQRLSRAVHAQKGGALDEYADYLAAIFARVEHRVAALCASRRRAVPAPVVLPLLRKDPFAPDAGVDDEVVERIRALSSVDALAADDAVSALLDPHRDVVSAILRGERKVDDELRAALVRGLARHADVILLRELFPDGASLRILPVLSALEDDDAAPFRALARVFRGVPEGESTAHRSVDEALADLAPAARAVVWCCLLIHPIFAMRALAAERTALSDFWGIVTWPRTPISTLRVVFEHVQPRARPEYLKVFFLCVKDALVAAPGGDELEEAFLLVERFFGVPCFHEDVVFEPLLDVDRALRARRPDGPSASYDDRLGAFMAGGVTESRALDGLGDVPLPIQRKLAREGHFLDYFVAHPNERVAAETLPHLLKLEDIVRYLRIPTIHRAVLVELARHRRLFRKEATRLALLTNPKTPANVARVYVPLLPSEQVRLLAQNKHISLDVRTVASRFLAKLSSETP